MKGVAIIALALVLAVAALENPTLEDGVLILNDSNFEQALKDYPVLFVKFYAEWCGHCKKLAPEWVKAAKAVEGSGITFAQVNVPDNKEVGGKYEIQGFPTLFLFVDGVKNEYQGAREAKALEKFARKFLEPAMVVANDKAELDAILAKNAMVVAGEFKDEKAAGFDKFDKLAKSMRTKDAVFVQVKQAGLLPPKSLIAIYRTDIEPMAFGGELVLKDLQDFVEANSFPVVAELGPENYMDYYKSGIPLTFCFVDMSKTEVLGQVKEVLKAVGKKHLGKVLMTYTDGIKFRGQVERMGLKADVFPSISIQSGEQHYNLPQETAFTEQNVMAWYDDFVAGKMKPTIKSEPIPEKQESAVFKVVADNFISVVMDPTKDVMVKFFAPWCGHCKALAPIYLEMAEKLKEYPNLIIAEMDATANDIPVSGIKVQGFPTLMFFPADNKKGYSYEGDRSLKDMLDFITEHTTFDINMPSIPEMGDKATTTGQKEEL